MRTTLLALPAALVELTTALHLLEQRDGPLRVLGMDTERRELANPLLHDRLRRRQSTLTASLDNEETLYYATVSLGTPGQKLRLAIDTGSSDLWTNSPDSQICQLQGSPCSASGTYDANSSSTYQFVSSDFQIQYADGSSSAGDYATDTLSIGGQSLTDMQFGIGYNSTSENGILGIGYEANEVQNALTGSTYPNLPALLVQQNVIQSNAYSLWLNDLDANTGSILFGGVDTDKYSGSLQTVPIISEQGGYSEFIIALTGLSAGGKSIFNDTSNAVPVLLDSGSSLSYLPNDYVDQIYTQFNADYRETQGAALVDCDLANQEGSVDFTFSSPTISVPLNELVITAAIVRGNPVCILGISPAGSSTSVLGDTFLRSAYVVYDLDNNEISLAATDFNATSSDVREIGTGSSAVPDATLVAGAVSTAASAETGGARAPGAPDVTESAGAAARLDRGGAGWGASVLACGAVALAGTVLGGGLIVL